ncbi:hypothetical protein I656_02709 [Geobacillus sp. WSUCF1]|nr:hypothetical protein I656_02709 [Geobacillus sp. WSUCF1]
MFIVCAKQKAARVVLMDGGEKFFEVFGDRAWRMSTYMPRRTRSSASSAVTHSWSVWMRALR